MNIYKHLRTGCAALLLAGGGFAAGASQYPNIDGALRHLNMATEQIRVTLVTQTTDQFGGHLQRAMKLMEDAQTELRQAQTY